MVKRFWGAKKFFESNKNFEWKIDTDPDKISVLKIVKNYLIKKSGSKKDFGS